MTIVPTPLLISSLCVLLVVLGLAAYQAFRPSYAQRTIMTPNETEFFFRLTRAHQDGGFVFPQVALSALMQPGSNGKRGEAQFRRISQKRVDYSIHAQDMSLICVVELDDRTHDAAKDAVRDRLLLKAGIETLRWESRTRPSVEQIRNAIQHLHPQRRAARGST